MKQGCFEGCQFGSNTDNCVMVAKGGPCPYGVVVPGKIRYTEDKDPALGEITSTDRCPTRGGA